jgi:hypothetical protein
MPNHGEMIWFSSGVLEAIERVVDRGLTAYQALALVDRLDEQPEETGLVH